MPGLLHSGSHIDNLYGIGDVWPGCCPSGNGGWLQAMVAHSQVAHLSRNLPSKVYLRS